MGDFTGRVSAILFRNWPGNFTKTQDLSDTSSFGAYCSGLVFCNIAFAAAFAQKMAGRQKESASHRTGNRAASLAGNRCPVAGLLAAKWQRIRPEPHTLFPETGITPIIYAAGRKALVFSSQNIPFLFLAQIFYITGPIQSRKTTQLTSWCAGRTDTGGLLSPVLSGKRCFLDIRTQACHPMEAEMNETEIQQVGRYTFSARIFAWANTVLLENFRNPEIKWLVIDEIGPLELQGKGLEPALQTIFNDLPPHLHIILVIREKILENVLEVFDLKRYGAKPFHYPEI
jgi:nucleoside-triphosphatase THEP1